MKRIIMLSTLVAAMALMLALAGSTSAAKPETEMDTDKLCKALA